MPGVENVKMNQLRYSDQDPKKAKSIRIFKMLDVEGQSGCKFFAPGGHFEELTKLKITQQYPYVNLAQEFYHTDEM